MSLDERTPARLLSGRNEPSVLEKEAIFEEVMKDAEQRPLARPWRVAATSIVAAAAAFAVWFSGDLAPSESEFSARGQGDKALCVPRCLDAGFGATPCHPGMKVHVELKAPRGRPFFALFVDRPDQARVWYFPAPDRPMPNVSAQRAGQLWSEAARLDPSSPPGSYTWIGVFSEKALSREQLKQRIEQGPDDSLTIVKSHLEVQP